MTAIKRMCCRSKEKANHSANMLTLDGVSYFPREFIDFKQFNSTKAHVIADEEDDEEHVEANDLNYGTEQKQVPGGLTERHNSVPMS